MSNYYYQNRNGVRIRVRKGRNRLRIHKGKKIARASVRGAIPTPKGEVYGKGVIIVNDKSKSIKGDDGVSVRRRGGVVVAAGKLGRVKGGIVAGYKKGRKIDAIADYSNNSDTANFGAYYTRTRKGKRERVRKSRPSILGRVLGRNRTMYTSRELNEDLAKELAKEMKANPPKTFKEKLLWKRYPKAERRAIARYKKKYKSFSAEFPTLAQFAQS